MRPSNRTEVLVGDHFERLPLGGISEPYTAAGEYHVVPPARLRGCWEEATVWHSWPRNGGNWLVAEDSGARVLEQSVVAGEMPALLVTGKAHWRDLSVQTELRVVGARGAAGVVVGYRHARHYLAVWLGDGALSIELRHHEERHTLARTAAPVLPDEYQALEVILDGNRLEVRLGEVAHLTADLPDDVAAGKVGLIATTPARFRRFEVLCTPEVARALRATGENERREAAEAGAPLPQPVLWRRVRLGPFGSDRNLRLADLDGDGEPELLLAQKMDRLDGGNYPLITCLAALKLDGELLWKIGEPTPERTYATADLCFQVHDLDGCGRPEVVFAKDFRLQVADGRTGEVKLAVPTPPARADGYMGGPHFARNNGDSLLFADLEGRGRAANVVLKDRYSNFWVYDDRLELLWERSCNTGHFPAAHDLDGDGAEELLVGYSAFRGDGTLLWDLGLGDHCDGIAVGRFAGPDSEVRIALAAGEEGFRLVTVEGQVIATHRLGHVQKLTAARLRASEEVQFCTITYWGEPGVAAIIAADGTLLHEWEPFHYASALPPVNWAGDGVEQLLLSAHPQSGGFADGWGRRVLMLPDDGHPTLCSTAVDLTGDPRDEVVCWDFDHLWIYTQDDGGRSGCYRPRRSPAYNESNYKAHVSLPW